MKLVIDIPEDKYDLIRMAAISGLGDFTYKIIANGTPLPKGHGDLIDRNSILCDDCSCEQCGHTDECFKLLAKTIIKADKEE